MAIIERDPRNTVSPTRVVPQGHGGFAAEPQSVMQSLVAHIESGHLTQVRHEQQAPANSFNRELNELLQRANISQASQTEGPNGNRANVTAAQPATQNSAPTPGH